MRTRLHVVRNCVTVAYFAHSGGFEDYAHHRMKYAPTLIIYGLPSTSREGAL